MKYCDDCDWGHVFLYVDGVTGKNAEWFCRECGKKFTDAEVEKLDGEIVAPHAGAWIETGAEVRMVPPAAGRAPCGRVD